MVEVNPSIGEILKAVRAKSGTTSILPRYIVCSFCSGQNVA